MQNFQMMPNGILWNSLMEIYRMEPSLMPSEPAMASTSSPYSVNSLDSSPFRHIGSFNNDSCSTNDQTPTTFSSGKVSSTASSSFSIESILSTSPNKQRQCTSPTLPVEEEWTSNERHQLMSSAFRCFMPSLFSTPQQSVPFEEHDTSSPGIFRFSYPDDHCSPVKKELHQCQRCPKSYSLKSSLKLHEATHTMPFQCRVCSRRFSRQWLLNSHERIHTGERPFQCCICGKKFADKSNMRNHERAHMRNN